MQADAAPDPLLLDARSLARLLETSTATVWRWDAAARLPVPLRPTTGTTRWRRADIERWIELGCPNRSSFEADQGNDPGVLT